MTSIFIWIKGILPLAGAFCAIGLYIVSRSLCQSSGSFSQQLQSVRDHPAIDDAAGKQMQMLRAEVYRGQSDMLQAIENLRLQMQNMRAGSTAPPDAAATRMPSVSTPPPVAPPPPPSTVTSEPLWPVPKPLALQTPLGGLGGTGIGPVWDNSKVAAVEMKAEKQYWYQRNEKNAPVHAAFIKYNANWPCLWGEEYTGRGSGDGNKWTCGARLIQSPCVVYSFGSNNDIKFEWGMHELGLNCEIHIFDPTVPEPAQARSIGAKYHRVGLSGHDGFQGRFPVKTLKSLMAENGHQHIDILKMDIEDAEHEAIPQMAVDGWPSIGQFLVEVHIRGGTTDQHLDRIFQLVEKANLRLFHQEVNWEFGPACCTEYAFIHKDWRPETKNYDMKHSPTYQDIPLGGKKLPPQSGWGTNVMNAFRGRRP